MTRELPNSRISNPNSSTFGAQWKNKQKNIENIQANTKSNKSYIYPSGNKHIPQKLHFEDDFPFPKVGYVIPWRVPQSQSQSSIQTLPLRWPWVVALNFPCLGGIAVGFGMRLVVFYMQKNTGGTVVWARLTDLLSSSCKIGTSSLTVHVAMLKIHFGFHSATLNCSLYLPFICEQAVGGTVPRMYRNPLRQALMLGKMV